MAYGWRQAPSTLASDAIDDGVSRQSRVDGVTCRPLSPHLSASRRRMDSAYLTPSKRRSLRWRRGRTPSKRRRRRRSKVKATVTTLSQNRCFDASTAFS